MSSLTFDCGNCGATGQGQILTSRVTANGTRRRRMCCSECGYRWTGWERDGVPCGPPPPVQLGKLSDQQLMDALVHREREDSGVLAMEWGVSRRIVDRARAGQSYRHRLPGVQRPIHREVNMGNRVMVRTVGCASTGRINVGWGSLIR